MATDFTKPINTTTYLTVWDFVRDNIDLVSTWFDEAETPGVNIPTNAKRFSATNKRFEYYSGSAWLELLSKSTTAYDIRAAVADLADTATASTTAGACTGNSATASLATNSLQLGGYLASTYTQNSDIRPVLYGGTGSNTQSGARTNLDVDSSAEVDNKITNALAPSYTTTTETLTYAVDTVCSAPTGYQYCSHGADKTLYNANIGIVSVPTDGSSITLYSQSTGAVAFLVWKKRG